MHIELLPEQSFHNVAHFAGTGRTVPAARLMSRAVPVNGSHADCHAVRIVVDRAAITIVVTGESVVGGPDDGPGAEPVLTMKRIERANDGSLHVHLHGPALSKRLACALSPSGFNGVVVMHPCVSRDISIERLARALVATEDVEGAFDEDYASAVSVAIVTRLVSLHTRSASHDARRAKAGLQNWRLKRVIGYVDAHIDARITLADMAEAAGLTRMHFAHQFRITMGIRPHEYVMRRRIESAQDILLRRSGLTLVEVALSVGFQAQTHFTTTFKRFVGETPHRWRTSKTCASPAPPASRDFQGLWSSPAKLMA